MSRILLADESPHAQRMGEQILTEEGFEVVSLTNGETALLRLAESQNCSGVDALLVEWERWSAEVAESHTTYLTLVRLRSPRRIM